MSDINGMHVTDEPMGTCWTSGPCVAMGHRLRDGVVYHYESRLYLQNGVLILGCPWCGGGITPALLATWHPDVLHPPRRAA